MPATLDPEVLTNQLNLLQVCRRTLAIYMQQQATLGAYAPPAIITGIVDTRAQIQGIKDELRQHGEDVADQPGYHPHMTAPVPGSGAPARITNATVFISYKRRTSEAAQCLLVGHDWFIGAE